MAITLAWRSLTAHRWRSLLTILAVACGVGMVLAAAIVGRAAGRQAAELGDAGGPGASTQVMGNVVIVQAGLAAVGLIILGAAGFVILNAFAMAVAGRQRELATLRALGMRRGLGRDGVARLVLAEAGLLGLAGTAAGLPLGLGLAWGVMRAMGTLRDAPLAVPAWGLAVAAILGLGVSLAAALHPARTAGRVPPIVASRPESGAGPGWYERYGGRPRVLGLGLALLAAAVAGMAAYGLLLRPDVWPAQAAASLGQGLLLAAAVLLLPALVDPVAGLCRPLLVRRLGAAGRLAADNLGRNRTRAALTAGALAAGLTVMVASSGLMTAGLKGAISRVRDGVNEDAFVAADLSALVDTQQMTIDNFFQFISSADTSLGAEFDLAPAQAALEPLVARGKIDIIRYRFAPVPAELSAVPGAPGLFVDAAPFLRIGNFEFFAGDADAALTRLEQGRAVLLMPLVAEQLGVEVGDEVPVEMSAGQVLYTVAGIGGGGLMMPVFSFSDLKADLPGAGPSFLGIVVRDGAPADTLADVEAAIALFPGIVLLDHDASLDPVIDMISRLELLLDGLLLLAVLVAGLGVANTLAINVAERRREIGLLRAVGATQRQVRQALVAEAAMLGLLAALVAGALGLLMLLGWGVLVLPNGTNSVGIPADWDTVRLTLGAGLRDWAVAALVALIFGPLAAGLAAYLPARRAAAVPVVEATRSEQITL